MNKLIHEGLEIYASEEYPGWFASKCGRVFSNLRKNMKELRGYNSMGYRKIEYKHRGGREYVFIHRLIASMFVENPKNVNVVNHIDADKLNNHYTNLEWCTHKENNQHARQLGLIKQTTPMRGEKNGMALLNSKQVYHIKKVLIGELGLSNREIGNMYNVSADCIYDIKRERSWKHIKLEQTDE